MPNTTGTITIGRRKSRAVIILVLSAYLLYTTGNRAIEAWHQINGGSTEHRYSYLHFAIILFTWLMFASFFIFNLKTLLTTSSPLVLSNEGLTDTRLWTKFIPWSNISEVQIIKFFFFQKFIALKLKNPEEYLQKTTNPILRFFASRNINKYGSPFFITATGLECSAEELKSRIENKWNEYQNAANPGV